MSAWCAKPQVQILELVVWKQEAAAAAANSLCVRLEVRKQQLNVRIRSRVKASQKIRAKKLNSSSKLHNLCDYFNCHTHKINCLQCAQIPKILLTRRRILYSSCLSLFLFCISRSANNTHTHIQTHTKRLLSGKLSRSRQVKQWYKATTAAPAPASLTNSNGRMCVCVFIDSRRCFTHTLHSTALRLPNQSTNSLSISLFPILSYHNIIHSLIQNTFSRIVSLPICLILI